MSATLRPNAEQPPASDSTASTTATEAELITRERSILRSIVALVAERVQSESKVAASRSSNTEKADAEYHTKKQAWIEKAGRLDREARAADEARRRAIVEAALAGETAAKSEFADASRRIAKEFDVARSAAKAALSAARSDAESAFESGQRKAAHEHAEAMRPIIDATQTADAIRERAEVLAEKYQRFGLDPNPPAPSRDNFGRFTDPVFELLTRLSQMEARATLLEGLVIPKVMRGWGQLWLFALFALVFAGLALAITAEPVSVAIAAGVGLVLAFALRIWLARLSSRQLQTEYVPLMQAIVDAGALTEHCRGLADGRLKETRQQVTARRDDELKTAHDEHANAISTGEARRDERLRKINETFSSRMVELQTTQQRDLRDAIAEHDRRLAELREQGESTTNKIEAGYSILKEKVQSRYETSWKAMADRWRQGIEQASARLAEIDRSVGDDCPAWDSPAWAERPLARRVPPVVRFGAAKLDLAALPGGISTDARLTDGLPATFDFPALRTFPARANLLVEAPADGRAQALAVLQASMFRLLTSLPPGLVRFTIIDPIGIGKGFGAFMHLSDFDPALVTNQIWTDPREIEERLAELAAHMEKVTQKYLRNEYATIEEYNSVAGEVAEPYRVLVVADFPARFDEKSAARLAAIAANGASCGVFTLIAADPTKPMPREFGLDDLRPHCVRLNWDGARLVWDDHEFGPLPLSLDPPPPADFATREIQKVGAAARDAKRVEVPFEFIAPPGETRWTLDSRTGIDIPLGKAGATKRQNLTLGHGTSQHVLVAGRTGSGKSTLMHALITNLALHYSPDEVEFYLIDFKKGVEFKVYATHELPHASVVAIESEREFGLSVLQRIDAELRMRADRFRDAGVQDINGYRDAAGSHPLPRILLIVDEFQEFFVEEDKLAQEAALLLDRLVRQGRAFGVHVLLGSQSLGGAFTLARSTLGQMAVRIALQCSEVDANLILSEQNTAARMLSRPGEAIYNDANGAPEGNHFFQVVWLSDERREMYLREIRGLTDERKPRLARTPIVFEGDAPAELARNPLLRQRIDESAWPESARSALAWLGDAIAIKDPTAALMRRQAANHLLIVGQNAEAALGVASAALLSLAAQFPPAESQTVRSGARFYILDGTPEDQPDAGSLARVAAALPHRATTGDWRAVPVTLAAIAADLERRQQPGGGDGPETFLFLHDLARFRDLRRKEDDFSFSRKDETASPADQLDAILREGPAFGIHVVAWCDTMTNLNRYVTHQLLRELGMRVLFQMSPIDSGHLLDSPAASKLGPNRALFASEEENRLEKFRPYRAPGDEWLKRVGERLSSRAR